MKRKWRDHRGETLVEVLASILIGSLSVALLFSMAMAAGNMGRSTEAADKIFNESLNKAEEQTDPVTDPAIVPDGSKVTVTNSEVSDAESGPEVTFYGGRGALSYALSP